MPDAYASPGVFVEEVPSGVRTIEGVSTSETAFVDFFPRGPVNKAVRVTGFSEFERLFGGLDARSEASYGIAQYFLNGGGAAWVVRVAAGAQTAGRRLSARGSPPGHGLRLEAASPGAWGNNLRVAVDWRVEDDLDPREHFNLVCREVRQVAGKDVAVATETYRNLTMDSADVRHAVTVVNDQSVLVRLAAQGTLRPEATGADVLASPQESDFLPFGEGGEPAGVDGIEPGTTEWRTNEGAAALLGRPADKTGLYALERNDASIFNILCLPAAAELEEEGMRKVYAAAIRFCRDQRAFLIIDLPSSLKTPDDVVGDPHGWLVRNDGLRDRNAATYFPCLEIADPLNGLRPRSVGASGTMAGIYARTDATGGVWKPPVGREASLRGTTLATKLTDLENGALNAHGVNALRNFPRLGNVSWGARTLEGADGRASEWKYIHVRRTALFIEESLWQGSRWAVFEPNDEPLWAQVRLDFGAFLLGLFRQGAFQGRTPSEAYFVKCGTETTTQDELDQGIVNANVGFAPLKPAEFVVIRIQLMAGRIKS